MGEQVLTEIPSFLKHLARLITRGFYQIEDYLIMDMLVQHNCETKIEKLTYRLLMRRLGSNIFWILGRYRHERKGFRRFVKIRP